MIETDVIEFKAAFVNDLNKEVIAFANTNGGEIYIGLDDNGKPCGLNNINDVELQCVNHITNTIKPDVSMFVKYEKIVIDGQDVLKIIVNKGSMSPYYIAGKGIRPEGVYVRMGTASVPATETTIVNMIKETTGETYEDTRSLNQNLTFIQAEQEFSNAGISFGESQKKSLGIIGRDGCYTNLGLLLSDQCEHKIKFAVYEGVEAAQVCTHTVCRQGHDGNVEGKGFAVFGAGVAEPRAVQAQCSAANDFGGSLIFSAYDTPAAYPAAPFLPAGSPPAALLCGSLHVPD